MPANLEFQSDADATIQAWNFGAVDTNTFTEQKFKLENTGNATAGSVELNIRRLVQNDGVDFAQIAPDMSGSPGAYGNQLLIGSMAAAQEIIFWVKVSVPNGETPYGNPRQFSVEVTYTGT